MKAKCKKDKRRSSLIGLGEGPRTPPTRPHPPRPASPQGPLNPFLELPELGVNNSVEMALVVPLLVPRDEFRTVLRDLISCP